MSARKESPTPFLEEADGPILVGVINQLIEAFDIEALSLEAALLLYLCVDRIQGALWRRYPTQLLQVFLHSLAIDDDDDDDDDEPDDDESDDDDEPDDGEPDGSDSESEP
jgi:hypothetical protein